MNDCTYMSALPEFSSITSIMLSLRLLMVPVRRLSSNSPSRSFAISARTRSLTSSRDCPCLGFAMMMNSPASGRVYDIACAPSTFCCWLRLRSIRPAEPFERMYETTSATMASCVPAPGYFHPIMTFSASSPYTSFDIGASMTLAVSNLSSGRSLFGSI